MARVLGVGEGFFVLAFIWALCLFLCIVFSRAQTAISNLGPLMIILAGFLTVILVFIPREPQTPTEEEEIKENAYKSPKEDVYSIDLKPLQIYDYAIIYRSSLIAVLALFIVIGLVFYLTSHAMHPVYAKPVRKLRG